MATVLKLIGNAPLSWNPLALVLRFWNNDVLTNIDGVLELMAFTVQSEALKAPHPARKGAPSSPRRGEGS